MFKIALCCLAIVAGVTCQENSASNLAADIYKGCLSQYSYSCIKPKALAWMSSVVNDDIISITDDLTIVKTGSVDSDARSAKDGRFAVFSEVEDFLATHTLKIRIPESLTAGGAGEYVPRSLLQGLPESLDVPLTEGGVQEGRGFVKKVMIPFLMGLKFKASVLVPIALALIALKTWKAITLGLISLVLSGAMVIFKFTKPKVVNYEVIHYPQHHDHHVEHIPAPAGWEQPQPHGPYRARAFDNAQNLAYSSQL